MRQIGGTTDYIEDMEFELPNLTTVVVAIVTILALIVLFAVVKMNERKFGRPRVPVRLQKLAA